MFALPLVFTSALVATGLGEPIALPHAAGDGVARLRSDTLAAFWGYDDDGNQVKAPDFTGFTKETVTLEAEAGVAPHLTLDASVPVVVAQERGVSFGDADVGGIFTIVDAPVTLGVSLDVKVPLYAGHPTIRGRDPVDHKVAVGDGQTDVTGAALFVAELPFDGAMDLYAGYRLRGGIVSDAVVGGGRIGLWTFDRRFFWSFVLDTVITLPAQPSATLGAGDAAFGPKVTIRIIDQWFLDVDALYVGRGENAVGGVLLGFGGSVKF